MKLALDFRYSSYDVYRKFPIYFAAVFCHISDGFVRYILYIGNFRLSFQMFYVIFMVGFVRYIYTGIYSVFTKSHDPNNVSIEKWAGPSLKYG